MRGSERRIVDGLLEAAVDGAPWRGALAQLAEGCRAQVGSMILVDRRTGRGTGYCIGVEDHWAEAFVARESRHVALGAHFVNAGQVFTDRMALPRPLFERSNFFNQWARPSGQVEYAGVAVLNEAERFAFVGLSRGKRRGAFEDDELLRLQHLAPHLRRATKIWLALGASEQTHASLEGAFDRLAHGVLITDPQSRVGYANRAAEDLLAMQDGLTAGADGLSASQATQTAKLRALVFEAAHGAAEHVGRTARVSRPSGRAPLTVLVAPLRSSLAPLVEQARVLVVVLDPDRPFARQAQLMRLMYGLSPVEALLACRISKGVGLKAAARELHIAPTTARTHLQRVFAKMGVCNQVQLAERVAQALLLR